MRVGAVLAGLVLLGGLSAANTSRQEDRDLREKPAATDLYGDPLPAGALARMGTIRLRHGNYVSTIAFSPNGKVLASAGYDMMIRLWNPATGKQLRKLGGNINPIASIAYSPDGKLLASG